MLINKSFVRNRIEDSAKNGEERKDVFYPMLEKAEIRRVRVHDLRYPYASIIIPIGCDLVSIREQLGYSSRRATADTYGHLLKGSEENPVDVLGNLLIPSAPYPHPKSKKKDLTKTG